MEQKVAQRTAELLFNLLMVQAFRKRVDVIHHRAQQLEVGLRPMVANFVHQVEQAMQHGSQGLMFPADDTNRFHGRTVARRLVSTVLLPS
jgi:hypothetical protein